MFKQLRGWLTCLAVTGVAVSVCMVFIKVMFWLTRQELAVFYMCFACSLVTLLLLAFTRDEDDEGK